MVTKACVIVDIPNRYLPELKDRITIPCHRHADAYEILNALGYRDGKEYTVVAEGFLNEKDEFMSRIDAWREAKRCNQFTQEYKDELSRELYHPATPRRLYSEDLW